MDNNLKTVFNFLAEADLDDMIPKCDAIFIFGSTNGDIAKHAAQLYRQGKAARVIISGRHRHDKIEGPFGFPSEAEYLASVVENEGVPKESILLETNALNTYENVIFGMDVCNKAGLQPKTLILVAIPYLLRRARACFVKNFPNIKIFASAMPVDEVFFTPYRVSRVKGELLRLVKYAELGTITPTVIPGNIQHAADAL